MARLFLLFLIRVRAVPGDHAPQLVRVAAQCSSVSPHPVFSQLLWAFREAGGGAFSGRAPIRGSPEASRAAVSRSHILAVLVHLQTAAREQENGQHRQADPCG